MCFRTQREPFTLRTFNRERFSPISFSFVFFCFDKRGYSGEETAAVVETNELSAVNRESQVVKEELSLVKEVNADLQSKFDDC